MKSLSKLSLFTLLVAIGILSAEALGQDLSNQPIPRSYFGLTVMRSRLVTPMDYGTTRSWDVWPEPDWGSANPAPGVYDFTSLDAFLAANNNQTRDIIYTLGRTPQWASSQPTIDNGLGHPGECAPPSNLQDWDNYLQAIVTHAAGRIKYWEIWNEPGNTMYYCGDIPTMVQLAQHAQRMIKSIDPTAVILSPAMSNAGGPTWLASFLAQGGASSIDVVAFHGYKGQQAEDINGLIATYKAAMVANGVGNLPLWDTEGSNAAVQTSDDESAFLAKQFLLHWSNGVSRFVWYAYDGEVQWGRLADPATNQPLPSASAYMQVYNWLFGATLVYPCSQDASGTWSCLLSRSGYQAQVLWNSKTAVSVPVSSQFTQYRDLAGNLQTVKNGAVSVTTLPILAETSGSSFSALKFVPIPTQTFGGASFQVLASSGSNAPVTYTVASGPATISGSTVTLTGAGTVVLSASQPSSLGYAATIATTSFQVAPAAPTLTFAPVNSQVFGVLPIAVTAGSVSSGPVTYSVQSGPATVAGNMVTVTGAGLVVLRADQAAAGNYSAATATTQFPITPGWQTITFNPIPDWAFATTNKTLSVSATSSTGATLTYAVVSGPATMLYRTVTPTGVGTVVLSASSPATRNYNAVSATMSFNIVPAPIPNLTFVPVGVRIVGTQFNVSATSASTGPVTYTVVSGPGVVSGRAVNVTAAGTVVLRADQAPNYQYAATSTTTSFQVVSATPTLTFVPVASQVYGLAPFVIRAGSQSAGTVTYSVQSGPATISGNVVTVTGAGTIVLRANQVASSSYNAATATTQFLVTPAQQTVSFSPIAPWAYGTTNTTFTVNASASPGGAVSFAVVSGPASVSYRTVTPSGVGRVVVSATVAATKNYSGAVALTSFDVVPAPVPTIAFTTIAPRPAGTTFSPSVASLSSGAFTYSVLSGPASAAGRFITLYAPGTVVLRVSQIANYQYAASSATTTLQVLPASGK